MRTGKPIKNKKHRDPRYFLHEDQEEQLNEFLMPDADMIAKLSKIKKNICEHEDAVIWVVQMGKTVGLVEEFGSDEARAAMLVINQILEILEMDSLEELAQRSDVQQALVLAIKKMCRF